MTKMPKEGTFSSVVSQKVSQRSCNVLKNQCFKSCSRNSEKAVEIPQRLFSFLADKRTNMCRKVHRNVVLELETVENGCAVFVLHLGCRQALPADFMRRYCPESIREKVRRWGKCVLSRLLGVGAFSYHRCRIPVAARGANMADVFDWRLEDAFQVLRDAGFLLYDDYRGEWTPYNVYRHLMQQGRVELPMPVLHEGPGGYKESDS